MSLSCPPRLAGMADGAIFKLGSFGNFHFCKKGAVDDRHQDPIFKHRRKRRTRRKDQSQSFGVRRHDCALERRDMSRRGKAATVTLALAIQIGFKIGLNWVRFHFLKKSKLEKSSMFKRGFAFFKLGSFSRFHF
jgi:hypothetical protein